MLKKRKLITILIINILTVMLFSIIVNASEVQEIVQGGEVETISTEDEVLPQDLEEVSLVDDIDTNTDIDIEDENSNITIDESDNNKVENKNNEKETHGNPGAKIKVILVPILFILALGVLVYRKHEDLSKILLKK